MKRNRILPIETPDRPRRPDLLQPMHADPGMRACAARTLGFLLLVFWLGLAFAIGAGAWPW